MQTKNLYVLIHIWTKGEVGVPWNRFKPSSKIFFLTVPRWCFFCGSFMLVLSCMCYAFLRVCLLMPCGHLLGKGWPLGFRLWCLFVKLSLSHWYPGSGVVLDCIDSWSLPIKHKRWGSNFKVAPNFCIFLYNTMETTGVRQGMGIMHSDVMDTVFHSGDAWDSMSYNWVLKYPHFFVQNELNIVLC